MQQLAKQGGEWQPPSQTAAKVSKARTPSLCTLEMVAGSLYIYIYVYIHIHTYIYIVSTRAQWRKQAQHCRMPSLFLLSPTS